MELDNARGWRPDIGEVLVGTVTGISKGWSEEGEKFYPIITIKPEGPARVAKVDKDGKALDEYETTSDPVAVHCFHAVLYARIVELRPELGERIGIKFVKATEKIKGQKKSTPSIYNVKIEGREANVWDVMEVDERAAKAAQKQQNQGRVLYEDAPNAEEPVVTATDADDDIPF